MVRRRLSALEQKNISWVPRKRQRARNLQTFSEPELPSNRPPFFGSTFLPGTWTWLLPQGRAPETSEPASLSHDLARHGAWALAFLATKFVKKFWFQKQTRGGSTWV